MRQARGALHGHILGAGHGGDDAFEPVPDGVQRVEVLSIDLYRHVLAYAGHQLIGAKLHGLAESAADAGYLGEPRLNLCQQLFLVLGTLPLAAVFLEYDEAVGEVHAHRVVGYGRDADASADGLHLWKLLEQHALHLGLAPDGLRERAAGPQEELEGNVALVEAGNELGAHAAEKHRRGGKHQKGEADDGRLVSEREAEGGAIEQINNVHQPAA